MDDYVSLRQARNQFRVGKATLKAFIDAGKLAVIDGTTPGGVPAKLVRVSDLEALGLTRRAPTGELFLEERVDLIGVDQAEMREALDALRTEMSRGFEQVLEAVRAIEVPRPEEPMTGPQAPTSAGPLRCVLRCLRQWWAVNFRGR